MCVVLPWLLATFSDKNDKKIYKDRFILTSRWNDDWHICVFFVRQSARCAVTRFRSGLDDRDGSLDAYMDDSPIVEYVRTTMDAKCQLRLVRQGFGEDAYGIGLPKNSNLKVGRSRVGLIEFHCPHGPLAFVRTLLYHKK